MNEQFKDKVIIVTGSTQGSGAETARLLAAEVLKQLQFVGDKKIKVLKLKIRLKN